MKKKHISGVHNIPGNIYINNEYTEEENDLINKLEKVLWVVTGLLGICVIFAQVIIHIIGR